MYQEESENERRGQTTETASVPVEHERLFDFAPVAYCVFDSEKTITMINHAAATFLATEREHLIGLPFSNVVTAEYRDIFYNHVTRIGTSPSRRTVELQLQSGGGDPVWARLDTRALQDRSGRTSWLTVLTSVTDRKRIEDDLILARENADAENRAKSTFLANMSHEIRTPMNGIMSMSELVLQTPLTSEQKKYIDVIHSSARSLLALIDEVLDVSRIEADHTQIEKEPFNLHDLVTNVYTMFRPNADRKQIDFTFEFADSISPVLKGDRNRIRQVLVNLVSNAIKHTATGTVSIRVCEGELSDFLREITFEVADTGPGIDSAEQRRIFEVFRRAIADDNRRYEEKRMGLAISRKLAKLMGGHLYFETSPSRGTCFFFSVPLELAATEKPSVFTAPIAWNPAPDAVQGRVLVAEDNSINVLVIRTVLEKAGFEVTAVNNGHEAIATLEGQPFDLVLMDISMPGMDGITATRAIRERQGEQGFDAMIPVIAISAHSMKGDRERFLEAGMNDYISKPFVRDTVLEVIDRHIRKRG